MQHSENFCKTLMNFKTSSLYAKRMVISSIMAESWGWGERREGQSILILNRAVPLSLYLDWDVGDKVSTLMDTL